MGLFLRFGVCVCVCVCARFESFSNHGELRVLLPVGGTLGTIAYLKLLSPTRQHKVESGKGKEKRRCVAFA